MYSKTKLRQLCSGVNIQFPLAYVEIKEIDTAHLTSANFFEKVIYEGGHFFAILAEES